MMKGDRANWYIGGDIDMTDRRTKIINWLIRKLAGDKAVVINVGISVQPNANFDMMVLPGIKAPMVENCDLPKGLILTKPALRAIVFGHQPPRPEPSKPTEVIPFPKQRPEENV